MERKVRKWFKKIFDKRYKYQFVSDVPDSIREDIIYIINNEGYSWQIIMCCPCGCKKNLHMNLMKEHEPYWKFEIDKKNKISLYPSIHRIVGCESHFFIKKGKIIWATALW